ncbi:MAG: transketolase [Anaerolineae bacterium]|nr:transketolase [Anaerolineae bacterium]
MSISTEQLHTIRRAARGIRRRVLEHCLTGDGGYLSQACSSAEILATLYLHTMRLGPSAGPLIPVPFSGAPGPHNPRHVNGGVYNGLPAPDLDRFILSPTHYALALYAALIEAGRLAPEGLAHFNRDGSSVEMIGGEHSPGLEVTGGSFGQAISQAAGVAMARQRRGDTGRVWVFMSDGEFQEGQVWEAFMSMAFHRVNNLTVFVDVNGQQVDGRMEKVMNLEPIQQKLEAFGARVYQVDGHDIQALAGAAEQRSETGPVVVLGCTIPYQGMPILEERYPNLHYVRFKSQAERERYRAALEAMPPEVEA